MVKKKKARSVFVCEKCGNESIKWEGKCSECGEWDSLVEMRTLLKTQNSKLKTQRFSEVKPVSLKDVERGKVERRSTGFSELDRVLGGGIVEGQAVLLAGEPGIGKSTLLLQVAELFVTRGHSVSSFEDVRPMADQKKKKNSNGSLGENSAKDDKVKKSDSTEFSTPLRKTHSYPRVLYVCGEESPGQIKIRAERLGIEGENIELLAETNVERILYMIQNPKVKSQKSKPKTNDQSSIINHPSLIIVDSIQALQSDDLTGTAGSVGQVKLCAQKLIGVCKSAGIPLFLVGQVTKEGTVAGPKVLEHIVDTVLYLEGERMEQMRLMRSFKNRFGNVDELAVFKMGERGMEEVADASRLFLAEEDTLQPGAVLCPIVAGLRILLVEIQSLVVPTKLANPRRVSQGFPRQRLEMIAAVLQKHLKLPLYKFDIFVNVSGGLSIDDPAADLAAGLSIYSSLKNKPLPKNSCAFGELTLLAGIRKVLRTKQRMEEVGRLGIKRVYSAGTAKYLPEIIELLSTGRE